MKVTFIGGPREGVEERNKQAIAKEIDDQVWLEGYRRQRTIELHGKIVELVYEFRSIDYAECRRTQGEVDVPLPSK